MLTQSASAQSTDAMKPPVFIPPSDARPIHELRQPRQLGPNLLPPPRAELIPNTSHPESGVHNTGALPLPNPNGPTNSLVKPVSGQQEFGDELQLTIEPSPAAYPTTEELLRANEELRRINEQLLAEQQHLRVARDWQERGYAAPQEQTSSNYEPNAWSQPLSLDEDQSTSVLVDPAPMAPQSDFEEQLFPASQQQMNELRQDPQPLRQPLARQQQPTYQPARARHYQDQDLPIQRNRKDCDAHREELLNSPITDIVVDIAPLPPEVAAQQVDDGITRVWTDCSGNTLGNGTLMRLERSYIIVKTESGAMQRISISLLSDGDLAVVNRYWALPEECTLGCDAFLHRCWLPNTMEWKASALCHKPLYFENIQLERYGHTHGPIMQPIRSSAHFFVHLAMLPYQTGIHPPNECIYALGYYRPGNCAPWLREPFPISLQGAKRQAAFAVGAAAILP